MYFLLKIILEKYKHSGLTVDGKICNLCVHGQAGSFEAMMEEGIQLDMIVLLSSSHGATIESQPF